MGDVIMSGVGGRGIRNLPVELLPSGTVERKQRLVGEKRMMKLASSKNRYYKHDDCSF